MIANAFGKSGIEFPWDEEKNDESDEPKVETTQAEIKASFDRYQKYMDSKSAVK